MRRFTSSLFAAALATTASAQDVTNTILVMDGSGSMWGQIDGVAKITIAQEVMEDLLGTLPEDQNLGLMAYGHRERGNCTDIELLVEPGPNRRDAIAASVDEISPLGKTPMTDAIIAAAESLKYTEEKATVILISDGVETCNPDPCAAARLLEQTGIDFTAHVVGFDVASEADALLQMQCIADETGGKFLSADNADQLLEALETVAAAPAPEPEPELIEVTFTAVQGDDRIEITDPILWTITGNEETALSDTNGNPLNAELEKGSYVATAYRVAQEIEMEQQFVAISAGTTVEIVFPEPTDSASIYAPSSAPMGSDIQVGWEGPDEQNDYIGIGKIGAEGSSAWHNYTRTNEGNPLSLQVPPEPGDYVISYFSGADREPLGSAPITVEPVIATLEVPTEAIAGDTVSIPWTGPDYNQDYIGIGLVDSEGSGRWENYTRTSKGSPLDLKMPTTPGDYVVTYFMAQDRTAIAEVSLTVTDVTAQIIAPAEATAGSTIQVGWNGPDYDQDYIGIGKSGAEGSNQWENYTRTSEGNPLDLEVPVEPGAYTITYFAAQDRTALAEASLTVTEVPAEVTAGSTINVEWTGPDYPQDYIGIGKVGADGSARWENYTRTSEGSPLKLQVPVETGEYVITYFAAQDRTALAEASVTVTDVTASLSFPAEATAGSTVQIEWTGPDYPQDYIGIGKSDAEGSSQWQNYARTSEGSPLDLKVPVEAGEYTITYFVAQDRSALAKASLTVTDVTANVTAPAEAPAGSEIIVEWTGPDYDQDYIGIGEAGASGSSQWKNYNRTSEGSPLTLKVPAEPGDYVITYFAAQDRSALAQTTITATEVTSTISAPSTAPAGSSITVEWTGPNYDSDYIGIGEAGASGSSQWKNYAYTTDGSPLDLKVPATPGDYLISYFVSQDRSILKSLPIEVTEVTAQLLAQPSAAAGTEIVVAWDGPDYDGDYIGIGKVGASGSSQWAAYAYTSSGNPVSMTLPEEPGDYLITYFMSQDRTVIKSIPLTIE